jgi:hypothetical protein
MSCKHDFAMLLLGHAPCHMVCVVLCRTVCPAPAVCVVLRMQQRKPSVG